MRTEDILRCLISFALFSSLLLWVEVCHVFGNPNARHPVTNEKLTTNCFKARGQITVDAELIDDADGNAEPESQMTWSGLDPHDENGFGSLTFVGPASVSPQGRLGITWGWLKVRR